MPMPLPAPMPMMNFDAFDPAYNFPWPDPIPDTEVPVNTEVPMDQMNWRNMDWSSLRNNGQGW